MKLLNFSILEEGIKLQENVFSCNPDFSFNIKEVLNSFSKNMLKIGSEMGRRGVTVTKVLVGQLGEKINL